MSTPTPDPKLLEQLKAHGPAASRYQVQGEVAHGGMGVILRVWDADLRRHLAMKVMLDAKAGSQVHLARFLEEAQVTGQLDHPGIVPVHELGIDAQGRVFFTMKLVKGITLAQVFDSVAASANGWNRTRALSVVLRVCEAMAFAHDKGVIHRDLKPANIMVGKFGETYVMDWGLARVLAREDHVDAHLQPDAHASVVRTDRRESASETLDSSMLTMEGDALGTPAYMPLEQILGDLARVGPQSDVYAVGAILYHLLTGSKPYVEPGWQPTPREILEHALRGPPRAIETLTDDVPAELAAICEKAMMRELDQRYRTMEDLADDLRAYLEGRVVKAYETGAFAEMKKWVKRNQGLAAAAAALLVVLACATVVVAHKNREVEAKNTMLGARKAEFDQLAGVVYLETALKKELDLYPPWPDKIGAMEQWLAEDAARLLAMKPTLTRSITELESRAGAGGNAIAEESQRFLRATLTTLAADIATFETGAKAGVDQRLAWARRIEDLTWSHPNARVTWDDARTALAKADGVTASTLYRAMPIDLIPQLGLVPIGMNPATKLWEFYELRSACDVAAGEDPAAIEIPTHESDGSIAVKDHTGIVFVLIPGGTFWQGAQRVDPAGPNFDALAESDEVPKQVTLPPYFLARHELTKGQWQRLVGGDDPSWYERGSTYDGDPIAIGWTHPIEQVSWTDSELWLRRNGMALPTEAQWERGARAGTDTSWFTGTDASTLAGAANVLDIRAEARMPGWGQQQGDFDDGFVSPAPVATYEANAYGLYDVHGNVWEWCMDAYAEQYGIARASDGLRTTDEKGATSHVNRGGGLGGPAADARCANRDRNIPSFRSLNLGVRAARALEQSGH